MNALSDTVYVDGTDASEERTAVIFSPKKGDTIVRPKRWCLLRITTQKTHIDYFNKLCNSYFKKSAK